MVKDDTTIHSIRNQGLYSQGINEPSDLTWSANDTPVSIRFDDCYYSKINGREETRTVFIAGNQFPDAWVDRNSYAIGELGFGTGLNFAETLQNWRQETPKSAVLTFVSFEKYPLSLTQIERALARWPDLVKLMEPFLVNWPPGPGRFQIDHQDITLVLYVGDARHRIRDLDSKIDSWFLDGFSPAKNPELWEAELLESVFEKTREGGTFSTFTSAGWVRRNLERAGFQVVKVPGFGKKRARLQGSKPVTD